MSICQLFPQLPAMIKSPKSTFFSTYTLKLETSSPAPLLTGSVFRSNFAYERTSWRGASGNDCPFDTLVSSLLWMLGSFFARRGLLCFVSASLLDHSYLIELSPPIGFLSLACLAWATLFAIFLFQALSHFSKFQSASLLILSMCNFS